MLAAGTGRGCQLRRRSSFSPWNSPQSTRTRRSFTSSRYFEPVTVRAAPRNVNDGILALASPVWRGRPGFSGEHRHLSTGMPEENGIDFAEPSLAHATDQYGSRLRVVTAVHEEPFPSREHR